MPDQDKEQTQSLSDTLKKICPEPNAIGDLNDLASAIPQIGLDRSLPRSIVVPQKRLE